jgi:hypothetical protein
MMKRRQHRRLPDEEDDQQRVIFLTRHSLTRSYTEKKWRK